jgi:hypothetical protein
MGRCELRGAGRRVWGRFIGWYFCWRLAGGTAPPPLLWLLRCLVLGHPPLRHRDELAPPFRRNGVGGSQGDQVVKRVTRHS